LHFYSLSFVAKKHKEETPVDELRTGQFVFSNGDRYGICSFMQVVFAINLSTTITFASLVFSPLHIRMLLLNFLSFVEFLSTA